MLLLQVLTLGTVDYYESSAPAVAALEVPAFLAYTGGGGGGRGAGPLSPGPGGAWGGGNNNNNMLGGLPACAHTAMALCRLTDGLVVGTRSGRII